MSMATSAPVKPDTLVYGLNDCPPFMSLLLLSLQHIFVMSSTLVLPIVVVHEIGGNFDQVHTVMSMSMLAAGIGTMLQALGRWGIGSGYLVPNLVGPSFLSVSVQAAWLGGLPLMHGMIIVAGFFEVLFSRVVHRLRFLFPPEITGLVVLMVGVALIPLGSSKFLGITYEGDLIQPRCVLVATLTLAIMIGINLWSRGRLKLYCVLIGMIAGYVLSFLAGLLSSADFVNVAHVPFFSLPFQGTGFPEYAFDWALLPSFLIISMCGALKSFGNIITAQKINDVNWKAPDMKVVGNGLLADGMSVIAAGSLGGMATDTSASNVGMSQATGATSRIIGLTAGAFYVCLAFFPKLSAIISVMPAPVMGAILIFVTSFMFMSGFQIILSEAADTRKIFVVGISLVFGLSSDILPGLYGHMPSWLMPIFGSSLTLATVLAILLNQLFSIKASR